MGPMVKQWNLMKSIQSRYWMVVNQSRWLFQTIVFISKDLTQHTLSEIAIASTKRIFTVVIPMTSIIKWIIAFVKLKTWKANSLHERWDFIVCFYLIEIWIQECRIEYGSFSECTAKTFSDGVFVSTSKQIELLHERQSDGPSENWLRENGSGELGSGENGPSENGWSEEHLKDQTNNIKRIVTKQSKLFIGRHCYI